MDTDPFKRRRMAKNADPTARVGVTARHRSPEAGAARTRPSRARGRAVDRRAPVSTSSLRTFDGHRNFDMNITGASGRNYPITEHGMRCAIAGLIGQAANDTMPVLSSTRRTIRRILPPHPIGYSPLPARALRLTRSLGRHRRRFGDPGRDNPSVSEVEVERDTDHRAVSDRGRAPSSPRDTVRKVRANVTRSPPVVSRAATTGVSVASIRSSDG